jgi:hypothetical protein
MHGVDPHHSAAVTVDAATPEHLRLLLDDVPGPPATGSSVRVVEVDEQGHRAGALPGQVDQLNTAHELLVARHPGRPLRVVEQSEVGGHPEPLRLAQVLHVSILGLVHHDLGPGILERRNPPA